MNKFRGYLPAAFVFFLLLLGALSSHTLARTNLLSNPGFEEYTGTIPPPGWEIFGGAERMAIATEDVYEGEYVLVFRDDAPGTSMGLRSRAVPASPGELFEAEVYVWNSPGSRIDLYLDFRNENNQRVQAFYATSRQTETWEKVQISGEAPPGTAYVSIILYSLPANTGVMRFDNASLIRIDQPVPSISTPATAETQATSGAGRGNLLTNPGFEEYTGRIPPPGWVVFSGPERMAVEAEDAYEGEYALVFRDDAAGVSMGLASQPVPAYPGDVFEAEVYVWNSPGSRVDLYLDFRDERNQRVQALIATSSQTEMWERVRVSGQAPSETALVRIILYSVPANTGVMRFDQASLVRVNQLDMSAAELEMYLTDETLPYLPVDGSLVRTNPPSFVWVPIPGAKSYRLEFSSDPEFAPEQTIRIDGIELSIYTPAELLDPATPWYWRVFGVTEAGEPTPPSQARLFRIAEDAQPLPLPPMDEVLDRIPDSHPRLFVTEKTLPAWREASSRDPLLRLMWSDIQTKASLAMFEPLPDEPPDPRATGVLIESVLRQSVSIAETTAANMELLAMAYLMSGEAWMGDAAKNLLLRAASWDPEGNTSGEGNWDAANPLLISMARAYTWAYDAMTEQERAIVRQAIAARAAQFYDMAKRRPYESRPYASHTTASLGTLGQAAIALYGEVPEAAEWLEYVIRIFFAVYPPWGGEAGGYSEGHAYWSASLNRAFWFMDALKVVTGLDLYQKPFFQKTGDFKMFTQPPYSKMGPFGDFADTGPNRNAVAAMSHLAAVYGNKAYQWYANAVDLGIEMGVAGFIRGNLYPRTDLRGAPPVDPPTGLHFHDIGWVVFHRDYLAPEHERIQFMFKSSWYGSYSHSMADQNTFTLEAFGEPLAISSGYRPWYGSRHHMEWTKATQAHNGILVNGRGQQVQSLSAKGQIIGYINGEGFSYTAGDASQAYSPDLLSAFVRHVVYVRPDIFVLYDELKAPNPSRFSWLFHAYHPMEIDPQGTGFTLAAPKADLTVRLWADRPLTYTQTDQFAVPLDMPMDKPVQWHLTATTEEPRENGYFLSVLHPTNKGASKTLRARRLAEGSDADGAGMVENGNGVLLEDEALRALVLFRRDAAGVVKTDGLVAEADVAAWLEDAERQALLLVNGRSLHTADGLAIEASERVTAEVTLKGELLAGSIQSALDLEQPVEIALTLPGLIPSAADASGLVAWRTEGDELVLHVAPGEHVFTIRLEPGL